MCLHNFSELGILFSRVPMGNWFWCYLRYCLYLKLLENGKSTVLKIIFNCYKGFCPLKTEIAIFRIAFRLKNFSTKLDIQQ